MSVVHVEGFFAWSPLKDKINYMNLQDDSVKMESSAGTSFMGIARGLTAVDKVKNMCNLKLLFPQKITCKISIPL